MSGDPGHAIHYNALERGTPIYGSDGEVVGEVVEVSDNHREHILDGIVFSDSGGTKRFVDGPEVQRTYERAVELNITAAQALQLGSPPRHGAGEKIGRGLGRLFKR